MTTTFSPQDKTVGLSPRIRYTTREDRLTQYVKGEIGELGDIEFARLDLTGIQGENLIDLLNSRPEWQDYIPLFPDGKFIGFAMKKPVQSLLIFDSLELIPEARGHGLGLHVMARAIMTWKQPFDLVLFTAAPIGHSKLDAAFLHAQNKLACHWEQLGLKRVTEGGIGTPLILAAYSSMRVFEDTLQRYCNWIEV